MAQLDLPGAFAAWLKERKQAFGHDRILTIGSSEIGACALRIGRRKSGHPVDKSYKDEGGFGVRGDVMEDNALVPVMRTAVEALGGTLMYAGQGKQLSLINEKLKVSATPDGLAVGVPRDALKAFGVKDLGVEGFQVEFKSVDPRKNKDNLPQSNHIDQVNQSMALMRAYPKAPLKPNYALLIHMDASNYARMDPTVAVRFDEEGWSSQLARAKHIMDCVAKGPKAVATLRPEGKIKGGKECETCEFAVQCLGYAPMVPKVINKASLAMVSKINKIAIKLKEATEAEEEWGKYKKETEAHLKETLVEAKTKWIETDHIVANWTETQGKSSWDNEGMVEELKKRGCKDPEKKFKRQGKPSERLSVKFVNALAR